MLPGQRTNSVSYCPLINTLNNCGDAVGDVHACLCSCGSGMSPTSTRSSYSTSGRTLTQRRCACAHLPLTPYQPAA
eukprot:2996036-Pyramimonas_sp.AAC.2